MKIGGRTVSGPNKVTLVLPREGQEDIVIVAQAVMDMELFDKMCPEPKPPIKLMAGGAKEANYADPGYKAQMIEHGVKRMAFIVLYSLVPSEIEWATVDLEKPSTWLNYHQELKEAGFSSVEVNRIGQAVMQANCLDEDKLEAARQVFLRGQAAPKESSGQDTPV